MLSGSESHNTLVKLLDLTYATWSKTTVLSGYQKEAKTSQAKPSLTKWT